MKLYNSSNFFKHTFCEFKQVDNFKFPTETHFKSKSNSKYFYTEKGVYRKSNHWGRVANCRWKLISLQNYKNQQIVVGFANWADFHPINSSEKNFFIDVNLKKKKAAIKVRRENSPFRLFSFGEAQKKIKHINHLFSNDRWTKYYNLNTDDLLLKIITTFINSNKSIQEIKKNIK